MIDRPPHASASPDEAVPLHGVPAFAARRYNVPRMHTSTVIRWAQRGVNGIVLRTFSVGGRKYVRPKDLDQFMERVNDNEPITAEVHTAA